MMKFSLFISLLSARVVWANQLPLSARSGQCLSSNKIKADGYSFCCPNADTANEDTAGGAKFHYTCASWAKPYDSTAHSANSAQECAELCASSPNFAAASWFSSTGKCYLTSSQIYTQYSGTTGALLLEKAHDSAPLPPIDDCTQQVAAAVANSQMEYEEKCQDEKAALEQEKARQAEDRKTEREECQAAKSALEQNTRERVEKCESEKAVAEKLNNKLNDRELSATNLHTLCPTYNGREFETTGPNGSRHKWRIYCNYHFVKNGEIDWGTLNCISPYQQLKASHEVRALAWQTGSGYCWPLTMKPGFPPSRFRLESRPSEGLHIIVRIDRIDY